MMKDPAALVLPLETTQLSVVQVRMERKTQLNLGKMKLFRLL
jgi:hypothetical protein